MVNPFEEAVRVALEIKQRMKKEVGDYLTCSIGIAENKLLAKIGSDLKKPDGIVVIANEEFRIKNEECKCKNSSFCIHHSAFLRLSKNDLYNRLKLTDIPGIAKRQEKRLNALGIKTLKDLRDYPLSKLVCAFGINGYHLHHMGQLSGSWKARVNFDESIKSIGHMYTLPKEYRKPEFFEPVLYKLCEMVGERLRRKKLMGNIVIAYVRDSNYNSYGHSVKLSSDIFDARDLFWESRHIIKNYPDINKIIANCKLVGVTIAGLKPFILQQSLFKKQTAQSSLARAVDVINAKYGKFTLSYAPVLKAGKVFRDSVGFGRVKEVDGDSDISIRPGKSFKK
jgi:DNA polymerase-4